MLLAAGKAAGTGNRDSPLSRSRMHRDLEPGRSGVSAERRQFSESQTAALCRDAATRFMERLTNDLWLCFARIHIFQKENFGIARTVRQGHNFNCPFDKITALNSWKVS
jgi:hypothetical protein